MSREAADVRTEGQCRWCVDVYPDRMLPVRDGVMMSHGRPVSAELRDQRGDAVEPCPGAGTTPL